MKLLTYFSCLSLFMLLSSGSVSHAQDLQQPKDRSLPIIEEVYGRIILAEPSINVAQIPSLFLTSNEEVLIANARKGLFTRPPTDSEFAKEQSGSSSSGSSPRNIALGGIIYTASNDWVIWLNSEKITPKNIPSEVIDIRVNKDYIRLKWLDKKTNQIYPVKLKSHQRFNLDTRIFLPGV